MEMVDYADQNSVGGQSLLEKYRVQVPLILLGTLCAQYVISYFAYGSVILRDTAFNSLIVSLVANIGGLFAYRNLRHYPGTRRLAFVIPSFAMSWSIALVAIIISRVPYSSFQLIVGLTCAMSLALLLNAWNRRTSERPFLMLASPRVSAVLEQLPELQYAICEGPDQIRAANTVIVADLQEDLPSAWEKALAEAAMRGIPIYHVKQMSESLTGRVQIEHLSENSLGTLAPDPSYALLKALLERSAALVGLIVLAPLVILAALAIRLDSAGPALFKQTRIGHRGRPFTIYKLRTMEHRSGPSTREDDVTHDRDPRITRLGHFLRGSRIDEVPQLYNVLRGEMSVIGPRPETVNLSSWYEESIDFYAYRHVVLPGITGWAQVKQGHVATPDDVLRKLQYDFYYIKNFSLWLDIVIAIKTVKVMMLKMGAR